MTIAALVCGALAGAAVLVRPCRVRVGGHRGRASGLLLAASELPVLRRGMVPWRRAPSGPTALAGTTVLTLIQDLTTQVRAGVAPARAWSVAADLRGGREAGVDVGDGRALGPELQGARTVGAGGPALTLPGETPRESLSRLVRVPGAPRQLLALGAAWALCDDVGAPLAEVLDTVSDAIRQDDEVEAEIESALAAPRATARLLAVLPVAGLGLGQLIGARPVEVLLHTTVGRLSALTGLLLAVGGQWWTRRLVDRTAGLL